MGTYVYAVAKTKSRNVRFTASRETARVHQLRYIYKPFYSWYYEKYNKVYEACIANMEAAWGEERPEYIAFELTDGEPVYRWTGAGISWVDCTREPFEKVGTLRCTNGRWTVEPLAPEPLQALENMDAALGGC